MINYQLKNRMFKPENKPKKAQSQIKEGKMRGLSILTAIVMFMMLMVMGPRDVEAQTQVLCPGVPVPTGWFSMSVTSDADLIASNIVYNAGMLGTVENFNNNVVAGLDWLYDQRQPNLETNMVGTQLTSWWTRKDGRNTVLQITNTNPNNLGSLDSDTCRSGDVNVHVEILGEDCGEILNFCDSYTGLDTGIYDLSDLVSNAGVDILGENQLAGREGIIVITPVQTCNINNPQTFDAVSWNFMQGNARIINEGEDWEYGANVRARTAHPAEPFDGSASDSCDTPGVVPAPRNYVTNYYQAVQDCGGDDDDDADPDCPANILFKDFNAQGVNTGADLVLFSYSDLGLCCNNINHECQAPADGSFEPDDCLGNGFGSPGVYQPGAVVTTFGSFAMNDDAENPQSCGGPLPGCFFRIGLNESIPSTDDVTPVPPEPECDFIDGEPNCENPLCKQEDGCENFNNPEEGLCEDGIDNDGFDGTDCADFGCDGFIIDSESGAACESGGETSCDDGFDNDNNGLTDCDNPPDPNCEAIGACDSPPSGGGGGCTVASAAGAVAGGTAAANFLLPLIPVAGAYALRRIRRRKEK